MKRRELLCLVLLLALRFDVLTNRAHGLSVDKSSPHGPLITSIEQADYHRVVYISQTTGSDEAGDGSQSKPWNSLQHAFTQVPEASHSQRVAILVALGRYSGQTLAMKEHVDLYGGFQPSDWQRDIFKHATILDGAEQHRVLIGANHTRLDGFIIRSGLVCDRGGAMICDSTSPTITNNRFVRNMTIKPTGWNPKQRHELANDGGAICCLNGAQPIIRHNVFAKNRTEIGRGAAISMHGRCAGEISGNIFLDNDSGIEDRNRSSDGGAISIFDWSAPRIANNILLENKARNTNDGGGIFVALWSSPVITGNIFVGNRSTDDGGALFVGGQEHRYGVPKDVRPGKNKFCVEINANLFVGNENETLNSGGMRVAMEARATIQNNIFARDARLYIQESDVEIVNNTILEDVYLKEMAHFISSPIANNVFWGKLRLPNETSITHSIVRGGYAGPGNLGEQPRFREDQQKFQVLAANYRKSEHLTDTQVTSEKLTDNALVNRIVKVDDRWAVIKSNRSNTLSVWGDISGAEGLSLLPTFQLHPESPGVDQGNPDLSPKHDIHGDQRPAGTGVDIGADEVVHDI